MRSSHRHGLILCIAALIAAGCGSAEDRSRDGVGGGSVGSGGGSESAVTAGTSAASDASTETAGRSADNASLGAVLSRLSKQHELLEASSRGMRTEGESFGDHVLSEHLDIADESMSEAKERLDGLFAGAISDVEGAVVQATKLLTRADHFLGRAAERVAALRSGAARPEATPEDLTID